mgnify:CR=1 FL=1|jgi:hypothetical protein
MWEGLADYFGNGCADYHGIGAVTFKAMITTYVCPPSPSLSSGAIQSFLRVFIATDQRFEVSECDLI